MFVRKWFLSNLEDQVKSFFAILRKEKSPMQQHKHIEKKKREGEKEDCFPKLVINIRSALEWGLNPTHPYNHLK